MRKQILSLFALLALASGLVFGQASMRSTNLSVALNATSNSLTVASATGISAPTTNQDVVTLLMIDKEVMSVRAVSGTVITVIRAWGGQIASHASGAQVWVGPPEYFGNNDKSGSCTSALELVLPYVNTTSGNVWTCTSSLWVLATRPATVSVTETRAATGTLRAITGEYTTAATMTSGNLVGVRGAVTMPSGAAISGSYLYGTQGKVITGTGTFSGTSLAGVYGQLDVTGGTISAGNVAAIQANIYGANSGSFALDGIYVEHAGGGVINSLLRLFGKSTYVFDLASNTHTQMGLTGAATTAAGWLKINVEGSTRYINLWSTAP
jgi:hypothetical protein